MKPEHLLVLPGAPALSGFRIEKLLAPRSQRTFDPFADRDSKACFRPLEELDRYVSRQKASQDSFPPASLDFHMERNSSRDFRYSVIEKRDAGFQTHRHRRPIHFAQDIVRQIGDCIAAHRSN